MEINAVSATQDSVIFMEKAGIQEVDGSKQFLRN